MNRRSFLIALAAPAIVRAESLMPVRARPDGLTGEIGFIETFRYIGVDLVSHGGVATNYLDVRGSLVDSFRATITRNEVLECIRHPERFLVGSKAAAVHQGDGRYSIDIPAKKIRG